MCVSPSHIVPKLQPFKNVLPDADWGDTLLVKPGNILIEAGVMSGSCLFLTYPHFKV